LRSSEEVKNLDSAYVSAFFGLAGATVGALTSFATTWLTQTTQVRERWRENNRNKRELLFESFITEATRLFADALSHEKDDVSDLVLIYALLARMNLSTSVPVIKAAESVVDSIIDAYLAENRSLRGLRDLAKDGKMNVLQEFAEACRNDLDAL
jgi:hypothetical protein